MNGRRKEVTKLQCSVYTKFRARITSKRNFSEKWLLGAESVHTSNIRDHAKADQHARICWRQSMPDRVAMTLLPMHPSLEPSASFLTLRKTSCDTSLTSCTSQPLKRYHLGNIHNFVSWKLTMELPLEAPTQMKSRVKPSHIT